MTAHSRHVQTLVAIVRSAGIRCQGEMMLKSPARTLTHHAVAVRGVASRKQKRKVKRKNDKEEKKNM